MGNRLSCTYITSGSVAHHRRSSRPFIRIVHALDGRTCDLQEPMKVGELMLEFPNHFVVEYDLQQLAAGKRVSHLPADHTTRASHVYFLLPMHRLNTRLSAEELDRISALASTTASSAPARAPGHTTKVTPLSAHQYEQAEMGHDMLQKSSIAKSYSFSGLEVLEEDAPQQQPPQLLHAMLRSRSWTPKLDTIVESSPLIM